MKAALASTALYLTPAPMPMPISAAEAIFVAEITVVSGVAALGTSGAIEAGRNDVAVLSVVTAAAAAVSEDTAVATAAVAVALPVGLAPVESYSIRLR